MHTLFLYCHNRKTSYIKPLCFPIKKCLNTLGNSFLFVQGLTLTFEGTCQVGQVKFLPAWHSFDLPCKSCDRMIMKATFLYVLILVPINYFPAIALSILLKNIGFPLCYSISEVTWWNLTCHVLLCMAGTLWFLPTLQPYWKCLPAVQGSP